MTYDTQIARDFLAADRQLQSANSEQGSRAAWAALKATAHGTHPEQGLLVVTISQPGMEPQQVRCVAV